MKNFARLLLLVLIPSTLFGQEGEGEAPRPPKRVMRAMADLAILHDGRVMPLDTYARIHLMQFSGKKEMQGRTPLEWLTRVLFSPEATHDDPLFLVNNHLVLDALGVEHVEMPEGGGKPSSRRFSYHHLQPGLEALERLAREASRLEAEDRGPVEEELIRLYRNVGTYNALTLVFAYLRPSPMLRVEDADVLARLEPIPDPGPQVYYEVRSLAVRLANQVQRSMRDPSVPELTDGEMDFLLRTSEFWQRLQGLPFEILPAAPHGEPEWLPPFDAMYQEQRDTELTEAARQVAELGVAWQRGDWEEARESIQEVNRFVNERMKHVREVGLTHSEARFNRANLFGKARSFYLLGFFLGLGALVSGKRGWRLAAWVPVGLALIWHVIGLTWRIYLTARPPVTNLYGTFLFVGLVCLVLALLVEAVQRNGLGLFSGSLICFTFLMLAERFGLEGDTMQKMQAVLASNFWLSTHVLAVTTGYAGVWLAGVFGHLWLIFKLMNRTEDRLEPARNAMNAMLGFGLTFAFLGTMLGGVWADQSWGRFWGWDPKENGAILIVLWTAVIYHARVGGMLRDVGVAAGAAFGCVVVMLAWLGVNLLGVGLHSYGFTSAMAAGFYVYVFAEIAFIGIAAGVIKIRESAPSEGEGPPPAAAVARDPSKAPPGVQILSSLELIWGGLGLFMFLILAFGMAGPDMTGRMRELGMSPFYLSAAAFVLFSAALAGGIGLGQGKLWGWMSSSFLMMFILFLKIASLFKMELRLKALSRETFLATYGSPKAQTLQHVLPMILAAVLLAYLLRKPVRTWFGVDEKDFPKLMILEAGVAAGVAIALTTLAMLLR